MTDAKQQMQFDAELPEPHFRELQAYAQEHGLSLDDALLRLASAALDMRTLGRSLGLKDFGRAPK
ncbi:hypothetical protein [Delftia tsuruhatensis]|uniref:hypothetical protein n=1 Tax=Delftia tsuruhatensis TaxID=180282 RepID=UPI002260BE76|nr:hypothetical protein [Delftia tsuruhatensis]MCX7509444.1 hypothetical protein [Delftia tsuruhatensis]